MGFSIYNKKEVGAPTSLLFKASVEAVQVIKIYLVTNFTAVAKLLLANRIGNEIRQLVK